MDEGERAREQHEDEESQSAPPAPPATSAAEQKRRIAERTQLMAGVDLGAIRPRLVKYAIGRRRDRNHALAEEHANEALTRGHDPDYEAWDPQKEPDAFRYYQSLVNGIIHNDETRAENDGEHATVYEAPPKWQRSKELTPEQLANLRGMIEACRSRVEQKYGKRGQVFLRTAAQTGDEQATELGLSPAQLRDLKRNVYDYCKSFGAELGVDGRGFERKRRTSEELALDAEIAAALPFWVRWRSLVLALLFFALAVAGVFSLFWFDPLGRKK